ncbi:hypothetical protein ACWOC0_11480 [Enterococcus italicus]
MGKHTGIPPGFIFGPGLCPHPQTYISKLPLTTYTSFILYGILSELFGARFFNYFSHTDIEPHLQNSLNILLVRKDAIREKFNIDAKKFLEENLLIVKLS